MIQLDNIPGRNENRRPMWQLEPLPSFDRASKHYLKKHPRELAALKVNLKRYVAMLNDVPNAQAVQAGFLHPEPKGVKAVDQRGGGAGLQETRLYTYADDRTKTLFLITIGNKQEQPADIQFCQEFVSQLTAQPPEAATE